MTQPLTTREQQVMTLIGAGCSGRAIADRLNIAYDTVRKHRQAILRKRGFTSSAQLVAAAAKAAGVTEDLDLTCAGVR